MSEKNTNAPILSIIIVNWNSSKVLINCIRSIYDTAKTRFEIIVVDNNSSDDSVSAVRRSFSETVLLEQKENLGYSKGNNLGVKHSRGEYALILNPDTILIADAAEKMLDFLKVHKNVGIVGPKILRSNGSIAFNGKRKLPTLYQDIVSYFYFKKIYDLIKRTLSKNKFLEKFLFAYYRKTEECECLQGCCMLLRRDFFESLGGFDESVPMYLDDIDMFYRCRKKGFKNFYLAEAQIMHLEQYSIKNPESAAFYDLMCAEAELRYYRKHFGCRKSLFFRAILFLSVPYLLALDIITLPYFLFRNKWKEKRPVFIKHLKYFELATIGKIDWKDQERPL